MSTPEAPAAEAKNPTLTKLQAASHQLDVAIRLFFEGDYLSSLTLAGAAEEILGKLSGREGKPVAVEEIIDYHFDETDPKASDKERRKTIVTVLNRERNAAKHAGEADDDGVSTDQMHPLQMIMRAMPMAKSLGLPPSREKEMVAWIKAHPQARQ